MYRIPGPIDQTRHLQNILDGTLNRQISFQPNLLLLYADDSKKTIKSATSTKAGLKQFTMPFPNDDSKSKKVQDVSWPLFNSKKPAVGDIKQQNVLNCALGALLTSLANTPKGSKHIIDMIKEHKIKVETNISSVKNQLSDPPKNSKLITDRYFTVKLGGKKINVSSAFYTDDSDGDTRNLIYMDSPNEPYSLWGSVIEKAYATHLNGYKKMEGLTVSKIWQDIIVNKPQVLHFSKDTKLQDIKIIISNAKKKPMIAASKTTVSNDLLGWHGYAILERKGDKVYLYDALKQKKSIISLKTFRNEFQAIFY